MAFTGFAFLFHFAVLFSADPKPAVVVKVNGTVISSADVEFAAFQQGVAAEDRSKAEPKLIEQLIDQQLIRAFLASKKIEPIADELQYQIAKAEDAIRKHGQDPQKVFAKIGYTPERLKSELGLPLAWQVYVRQTITPQQLKDYFAEHKQELDGTQLRGNQICLKLPKPADKSEAAAEKVQSEIAAKKEVLANLRRDIISKKLTFVDAVKQYSEAPSKEKGGDVGLFSWQVGLLKEVAHPAFALKINDISEPIVSPLGVHLIQVTERHPGDFSLEDVRSVILDRLSQQLWVETVKKLKATAKIEPSAPLQRQ